MTADAGQEGITPPHPQHRPADHPLERHDPDPRRAPLHPRAYAGSNLMALAVLLPAFGNHGLWAALMVMFFARTATLAVRYPALEAAAAPPRASPRLSC
jgi:hypothetical protein